MDEALGFAFDKGQSNLCLVAINGNIITQPPLQPPQVNGSSMHDSYNFGQTSPDVMGGITPGESPKMDENFASFDDTHFGAPDQPPHPKVCLFFTT